MMYQDTADMISRMISVPRATESPCAPQSLNAVRIFGSNSVSSSVFHDFLDDKKAKRRL